MSPSWLSVSPLEACAAKAGRLQATLRELQAALPNIELTCSILADPVNTDPAHARVAALARAIEAVTGQAAEYMTKHAASDARFFAARGVPAVVFGPAGGGGHGDDEWVDMASLFAFQSALDHMLQPAAPHGD